MAQDPVQLLAQADKAYSSAGSGFSWFGSKTEKFENAAELYIKAGAAFRVKKDYLKAGMAYEKAATIQGTKLSEPDDMANTLQDAFKAYRDISIEDAARCLSQAIDHYLYKGNFRRAATQKQLLAELYEQNHENSNARSAFAAAAQWYEDDNAPALASKLNLKAAEFAAMEGDYMDAIQRFEHVAKQAVSSNLLKYSVKIYLLKAGACHLAFDVIGAKRALQSYRELDPSFPPTPEYKLLADLSETVEQGDSDAFVYRLHVWETEDLCRKMDPWYAAIFNGIREQLKAKDEDFS